MSFNHDLKVKIKRIFPSANADEIEEVALMLQVLSDLAIEIVKNRKPKHDETSSDNE